MNKNWLILLFILFFISVSFASNGLNFGLVNYWKLDENTGGIAYDSLNRANLNASGSNLIKGDPGKIGSAFRATGNGFNCYGYNDTNLSFTAFTINAWLYRTGNPTFDHHSIVEVGRLDYGGFALWMSKYNQIGWRINNSWSNYKSSIIPTLNTWEMFTIVYNGSTVKIYKNAVEMSSDNWSENPVGSLERRLIIRENGMETFIGRLDEVGIWNRALTPQEISNLYNNGNGVSYPFPLFTDINIIAPKTQMTVSYDMNIDMNIKGNQLTSVSLYLISDKNRLIYRDNNIYDGIGITCNGYDFATTKQCRYIFNTTEYINGFYYIRADLNSLVNEFDSDMSALVNIVNESDEYVVGKIEFEDFFVTNKYIAGTGKIKSEINSNPLLNIGLYWKYNNEFSVNSIKNTLIDSNLTGQKIFAIIVDTNGSSYLYRSNDYGTTWIHIYTFPVEILDFSISDSNTVLMAISNNTIYVSLNDGITFSTSSGSSLRTISVSSTGQYAIASSIAVGALVTNNYGGSWSTRVGLMSTSAATAINSLGNIQYLIRDNNIHRSIDYGVNFSHLTNLPSETFVAIATNSDGNYIVVTTQSKKIYYSTNQGASWNLSNKVLNSTFSRIDIDKVNNFTVVTDANSTIISSIDRFNTYRTSIISYDWRKVTTGSIYSFAITHNGKIYKTKTYDQIQSCEYSTNNGSTWIQGIYLNNNCYSQTFSIDLGSYYTFITRITTLANTIIYSPVSSTLRGLEGSTVVFYVKDTYNNSIENVDLNIFVINSNNQREYYATTTTDVTGTAFIFMNIGQQYGLDVIFNNNVLTSTNNLVITTSPYYIIIPSSLNNFLVPDANQISIIWEPGFGYITNETAIKQTIYSKNVTDFNITIYQYQDNNQLKKIIRYTSSGTCNKNCIITTQLNNISIDKNYTIFIDINLGVSNSIQRYIVSNSYIVNPTFYQSIRNVRLDFGCSSDPSYPCGGLMIISIIITIAIIGAIISFTGIYSSYSIGIVALAVLGIFTYFGWFFWLAYALSAIIIILWLGKGVVE